MKHKKIMKKRMKSQYQIEIDKIDRDIKIWQGVYIFVVIIGIIAFGILMPLSLFVWN